MVLVFVSWWLRSFIGSYKEGYISDDKYPGYGKLHRTYVSDFDDFLDATEELTDSQTIERDLAMDDLKNDISTLENSHTKIPTVVQSASTLKERCYSALDSLDTSYNMLLKAYREQNKMHALNHLHPSLITNLK